MPEPQLEIARAVDTLVTRLEKDPEDRATLDELLVSTERWLECDGLEHPPEVESKQRVRLAEWVAHLARSGSVLHCGWREGAVASALSTSGASVQSYLDHPARGMAAAILYGDERVLFGTLDQLQDRPSGLADLVVIETAGLTPSVTFETVRDSLRAGGWLAVLGAPVAPDMQGLVDAGRFCVDGAEVRPSTMASGDAQLSLYRLASPDARVATPTMKCPDPQEEPAPAADDRVEPATPILERIHQRRGEPGEAERALRERVARVVQTPIPDQDLINWVGGGTPQTYDSIGLSTFHRLALYCGLKPWHRVLEPGCGCGRNARAIAPYLDPERGSYSGFDIYSGAIDWATDRITSKYPNVSFDFADIENTHYNPDGKYAAADYVFPYEDDSFDVVFMPSVFTHMTRDEIENYAAEIERVLAPGGLLLSWHFLLDEVSRRGVESGEAAFPFKDFDEVSMVKWPDNPCAAIAFDERWILELYESLGLRAQAVIHGGWSGRDAEGYAHDFQDRILARKPDAGDHRPSTS